MSRRNVWTREQARVNGESGGIVEEVGGGVREQYYVILRLRYLTPDGFSTH